MVILFTLFIYMFTCTAPDTLNVSVTAFSDAFGWDGSAMASIPVASVAVVFYSVLLGGMMNLMPSSIIQVFGRYDFAQANKIIMPMVNLFLCIFDRADDARGSRRRRECRL